ncbi:hypothetical protein IGI04_009242 [Brassica rapa subsp. trilocularis]|uniref:Uncharacterized protein n=1 Tax=Brassica rapa subsp. trilocularis TaxID=1813537 RepID=A0ABQ7MXU6_BRACM|nr:hypothetical protein IGI04_009242 [Brassica rapa subsp. trilocularis]
MSRPGSVLHIMKAAKWTNHGCYNSRYATLELRHSALGSEDGLMVICLTRDRFLEIRVKLLTGSSSIQLNEEEKERVVTSYTRKFPRNMTSCSFAGNISADPVASIRVSLRRLPKRKVKCCDVEYDGADVATMRLRDCR